MFATACDDTPEGTPDAETSVADTPDDAPDADTRLTLVAPPSGMYVGQYQWVAGDVATFERAAGMHTALFSPYQPMTDQEGQIGSFDASLAQKAWDEGYVVLAGAAEATPAGDFTVDRLLAGDYDTELARLADEFRAFGHPMMFSTAREPNGILANTQGGFGPDGTQDIGWAFEQSAGFAEFDPSSLPDADRLYADLGDPDVCDGLERLVAAQRYYYDFFVRREGIDFLTFDSMGWAVGFPLPETTAEGQGETHEARLFRSCGDFSNLYPGDAYTDWVSVTLYLGTWSGDGGTENLPASEGLANFDAHMTRIRDVAPDTPILVTELGFTAGTDATTGLDGGDRVTMGLEHLLQTPEVAGFAMWSKTADLPDGVGFLIESGTPRGDALDVFVTSNRSELHACAHFSDGSVQPNCDPDAFAPLPTTGEACTVGNESGETCTDPSRCSSGELVQGCCIAGTCG